MKILNIFLFVLFTISFVNGQLLDFYCSISRTYDYSPKILPETGGYVTFQGMYLADPNKYRSNFQIVSFEQNSIVFFIPPGEGSTVIMLSCSNNYNQYLIQYNSSSSINSSDDMDSSSTIETSSSYNNSSENGNSSDSDSGSIGNSTSSENSNSNGGSSDSGSIGNSSSSQDSNSNSNSNSYNSSGSTTNSSSDSGSIGNSSSSQDSNSNSGNSSDSGSISNSTSSQDSNSYSSGSGSIGNSTSSQDSNSNSNSNSVNSSGSYSSYSSSISSDEESLIICENTGKGLIVKSYTQINCTANGPTFCTINDNFSKSTCSTRKENSEIECTTSNTTINSINSIHCIGTDIKCKSSIVKCKVNLDGKLVVNDQLFNSNIVSFNDVTSELSIDLSSSASSIFNSFNYFILISIFLLLLLL